MSEGPTQLIESGVIELPVLPLRDVVVYPYMVIPLFVGRRKSIKALEVAMVGDKQILLVSQKNASTDEPKAEEIYRLGSISTILQLLKLPDGTVKVLVEGVKRGQILRFVQEDEYFSAEIEVVETSSSGGRDIEILARSVCSQFEQYVKLNKKIPPEILTSIAGIEDINRLADTIAAHLSLKIEEKQELLEIKNLHDRLERIMVLIETEIDLLQVEKRIRGQVKRQMEKTHREYYLNEQMKAIQKELGDLEEVPNELEELAKKIETIGMTKEAKEKAKQELHRLKPLVFPIQSRLTLRLQFQE